MPVQLMRAKFLAYLACLEDSAPYVARGLQASTGTTPEPCSTISATRTSSTPSDTPSFHPTVPRPLARLDWRPSRTPRVGTGAVRRISNELGCACGRCDPPVGGLLDSENCFCPL